MPHLLRLTLLCAAAIAAPAPAQASDLQDQNSVALTYADTADLALAAPVAAHVTLRRARPLRAEQAVGVPPGHSRFLVEADLTALIRGESGTPAQVRYLADFPNDARGRPARLQRGSQWLVFARPVPGRPGELQLIAPDAAIPYDSAIADRVRAIIRAELEGDAPPAVSAIGRAFHVPGALPGTGETQIFLQTARSQPVSITVARESGAEPRWFVSLSEFVDAGAAQPRPDSLLWYRLACFLPTQLPAAAIADAREHAQAIQSDYRLVREHLGACPRNRSRG
ncbi:hypothetical protein [Sphingosinicella sp. YJ22]|uniref:hypothetical protein n=1 Tax=Sphingosinicella sp. YJ22 TaxID=1104780 RepID=UPI001FAFEE45|nr:hypothetical protein [Sphingosinicella sp. YJ22]